MLFEETVARLSFYTYLHLRCLLHLALLTDDVEVESR